MCQSGRPLLYLEIVELLLGYSMHEEIVGTGKTRDAVFMQYRGLDGRVHSYLPGLPTRFKCGAESYVEHFNLGQRLEHSSVRGFPIFWATSQDT